MTSSMPWIKLYTEMLDDPKIGRLSDAIKWRFVSLVLLAGECDQDGALMTGDTPMSIDDVAWRMRITREQCVSELEPLLNCGVLLEDAGVYYLPKFSERQGRPQSEKRAMWRKRKAKQRESQESQESVTRESRVSLTSREEKSRVEKSIYLASDDADTAQKAKEVVDTVEKHRKKSERDKASEALEQHFVTLSGLPAPKWDTDKHRKASASRWKNPLLEIWELCGRDLQKTQAVINKAHSQMTHDNLTISAPASVLEVAKSIYAKNGFHGKDKVIEWI